ncbi:MAG: hypothetical protein GF390_02210 [Candidatus Pacebacteria bacterium]|nr:hypothetical protein [Candidatus Paceibacterota bacterium]
MPAAISGVLIVIATGLLAREVLLTKKNKAIAWRPGLIAMFLTAISPWAIIFSRAAWEVNLATALLTWGIWFGLRFLNQNQTRWLLASFLSLALSMYAYHAARIIAPLIGLLILSCWLRQFLRQTTSKKLSSFLNRESGVIIGLGLFFMFLISPILLALGSNQLAQRFAETSIFTNLSVIEESNQAKELAGNSITARLFYHRYVFFALQVFKNFFSHFQLDFLFISGDVNPRHSVQYLGQLYHFELILLFLGLVFLFKNWHRNKMILLAWLIIGILPASITKAAPHALRTLLVMPTIMTLSTMGLIELWQLVSKIKLPTKWLTKRISKTGFLFVLAAIYLVEFSMFWRYYTQIYPQVYAHEWQFGYEEMVAAVTQLEQQQPELPVYLSRHQGRPAMYYWFYTQTDPGLVQQANQQVAKDQGEFLAFENKFFIDQVEVIQAPAIVALSPTEFESLRQRYQVDKLERIFAPNGKLVWLVGQLE